MVVVIKRTYGPAQDRIPDNPRQEIKVGSFLDTHTHTYTYIPVGTTSTKKAVTAIA